MVAEELLDLVATLHYTTLHYTTLLPTSLHYTTLHWIGHAALLPGKKRWFSSSPSASADTDRGEKVPKKSSVNDMDKVEGMKGTGERDFYDDRGKFGGNQSPTFLFGCCHFM